MRRAVALLATTVMIVGCASGSGGGARGAARRGGILRMGVVGLTTLDPAQADEPTEVGVAEMLFAPLVRLDPRTHEPRPGVAARWHIDAKQTRFTFTLRRNARFTDGSAVAAADVKATLDRVAAKATQSPLAPLLESVVGYADSHDAGTAPGLSGVVARDPRTVDVTLSRPFSVFPGLLAHPGLGIVKAGSSAQPPLGSGPFQVGQARSAEYELVRAKRSVDGARLAAVRLIVSGTDAEAQAAFDEGKTDLVRPAPESDAPTGRRAAVHRAPYLALGFYAIDLANPKFADARFRQAIVRALDPTRLVTMGYPGRGRVARGLVPAGVPGGPVDQCHDICDYDPAAAKQLLTQAFPPGGVPSVAVDYDDSPTQAALAHQVVAQLVGVGIPAVLRPHSADQYASFLTNGDPELFRFGWVGDFANTDAFLSPLFVSGAPENVTHISSPSVDADLDAARKEVSSPRRNRSYRDAASGVLATFAVAPVVQFATRFVSTSAVREIKIDPFGGFDPTSVWLRPEAEKPR